MKKQIEQSKSYRYYKGRTHQDVPGIDDQGHQDDGSVARLFRDQLEAGVLTGRGEVQETVQEALHGAHAYRTGGDAEGKRDGKIYLIDEIHTPDSSRYFYAEGYAERLAAGEKQKQLSKEFVREWLMANGFQGQEGQQVPEMTPEIVASITDRYIELYENIVGEKFVKAESDDVEARIEKNVSDFLATL